MGPFLGNFCAINSEATVDSVSKSRAIFAMCVAPEKL